MKKLLTTLVLVIALLCAAQAQEPTTYTTSFSSTENPISEGNRWLNKMGYRYVLRRDRPWSTPVAEGSVTAVAASGNLVVIHTRAGFAQSVAAAVDSLDWSEVLGTVGGDDTVLVVLRGPGDSIAVVARLGALFSVE